MDENTLGILEWNGEWNADDAMNNNRKVDIVTEKMSRVKMTRRMTTSQRLM